MLTRLRRCAGWSAPLLFAYVIRRILHDLVQVCIPCVNSLLPKYFVLLWTVTAIRFLIQVLFLQFGVGSYKLHNQMTIDKLQINRINISVWWNILGDKNINWTASSEFGTYRLCEQRGFWGACAHLPVSPEPSLLAHTSSESRVTFRKKARSLGPLNGWASAVKICHDGMLEDTNSLDGAQLMKKYIQCYSHGWNTQQTPGQYTTIRETSCDRGIKMQQCSIIPLLEHYCYAVSMTGEIWTLWLFICVVLILVQS